MKNYIFIQDEDSHWYYIPKNEQTLFEQLCSQAYDSEDFNQFNERFESKMIGCHPKNFNQYYNEDGTKK